MLIEKQRKEIARRYLIQHYPLSNGARLELWKNIKSMKDDQVRSWCPIPCPYVHSSKTSPVITVGETIEECIEILKSEFPSVTPGLDVWDMAEIEEFEGFYVAYD